MAPRDFTELSERRAKRARVLAERYPESREVLTFFAEVASFQAGIVPERRAPLEYLEPLVELVRRAGPEALAEAAADFDVRAIDDYLSEADVDSPASFYARALLQPFAATAAGMRPVATGENRCPNCGHRPQVGLLRPKGEGSELFLVCSLCLREWLFPRNRCVACPETEDLAFHSTPDFEHLRVQTCGACRAYIHTVDLGIDGHAIPDVDELAALPLDVWAREQGYEKIRANLAGV